MKKIICTLLLFCVTISLFGCKDSKILLNTDPINSSIFQTESFVKIETSIEGQLISSGSGFVIKNDLKGSYILTARHVCVPNIQIIFLSFITKKEISLVSKTYGGKKYDTEVIKTDSKNDLCLLYSKNMSNKPVSLANKVPKIGEQVYLIGAPKGFSSEIDRMVPIILLIYNGEMTFKEINNKFQIYSGSLIQGVSGGMIVNKNGKVIGMANFSLPDMFMGAGTRLDAIKDFLEF